jgi:hypothetical protein
MEQKTIYQKLFEAKKEFSAITKDQTNPHFKSQYYDINDLLRMVEPILHKHGLMVLQPIKDGLIHTYIIDVETGDKIESSYLLEGNPNPQKIGSEITYFRRYLLSSLLSLQAEDDDGNKAATPVEDNKPWLNHTDKQGNDTPQWVNLIKAIEEGKVKSLDDIRKVYKVSKAVQEDIQLELNLNK